MADLIPCPSCKKKISVEAQACPKCGQPITDEARAAGRKKMKEEKRAGRVGCIFFILAALAIAGWLGKTDKTDKAAPTPAPVSQAAPAPQPAPQETAPKAALSFGITPQQFVDNYNAAAKSADTKQRAKITKKSAESVQLAMSKFYGALLTLDKNGKVTSVMGIGAGDGTMHSGTEIMLGFMFSIAGVRPDWPTSNRGEVIKALMDKDGKIPKHSSTTKDGVKFSISMTESVGIIFTAEPEK